MLCWGGAYAGGINVTYGKISSCVPCLSLLALTVFQLNAKFDFKLNWIHNPFPKSRYRPCAYIPKTKSRRHNSKSNLHKIFSFPLPFSYTVCIEKSVYHKRKCSLPFFLFHFHSQTSNNPFFHFTFAYASN